MTCHLRASSTFVFGMLLAAGAALTGPQSADAGIITTASFFNAIPHTTINFETDGAGNPISLIDGQRQQMPTNAYSALGVTFTGTTTPVYWVNDGNAAFDAAQILEGSPDNSIPSSLTNQFTLTFSVPVQSFGFFVANNRTADANGPSFILKDSDGNVIATEQWGASFIHGTTTAPNTTADYGFMGYNSGKPIASVVITKQAAILDDLRFSSVPTPGPVALLGLGGLAIARRRRA